MKSRVSLVTGATAGIGKVTALELARRGDTVIVVGRDVAKGGVVVGEIRAATRNGDVHFMRCDLSSQASIRALAAAFTSRFYRLDLLVNNAGAIFGERKLTVDGLEMTFATNHLAYFLLTNLLLDVIVASAPARIVSVASRAHRGSPFDLDDLQFARRPYSMMGAYGASKLANVAWTAELGRRLHDKRVTANCLHPGVIGSSFGKEGSLLLRYGMRLVAPVLKSPEQGAATTLYLASSREVEGVSGKYFVDRKVAECDPVARDPETGRRLWAFSEVLTARSA
jgi:NAD(P)-dependent dehydrogenase (short-subunit alcohol dehydrogenase family)